MRQFKIGTVPDVVAALISAAPASAEAIFGGPIQQNGKCWFAEKHSSPSEATWGYWGSCAEKAAGRARGGGAGGAGGAVQGTTRPHT
jgi:hypothetical protein